VFGIRGTTRPNLKTTQRVLGHSRAATTLDTYASVISENLDSAMGKLDAAC
jgi:hypothetical protein